MAQYENFGLRAIAVRHAVWNEDIQVHVAQRFPDGSWGVLTNASIVKQDPLEVRGETPALIALKPESAQELMDTLYQCGIRPSRNSGDNNEVIQAQKEHITDLQSIIADAMQKEIARDRILRMINPTK